MHGIYNMFRIEPQRIGVVIDAHGTDASIYALPVADLMERIFELAGCAAQPSAGGLITRQLITQLEGLRGAAVFKIPGVRRLLKTYGPTDPFTAKAALQLIGGKDPDNSGAKFSDHENLYIEAPDGHKTDSQGHLHVPCRQRALSDGRRTQLPALPHDKLDRPRRAETAGHLRQVRARL